jgi:aldehyde dehydrogenase (NAD+)
LGHSISQFHHKRVCKLLANHGGTVVIGNANAHKDNILQPTVILNPSLKSPLMKEEIFGPLLPIITYMNIEQAIEIIKSKEKPLVVYYFG